MICPSRTDLISRLINSISTISPECSHSFVSSKLTITQMKNRRQTRDKPSDRASPPQSHYSYPQPFPKQGANKHTPTPSESRKRKRQRFAVLLFTCTRLRGLPLTLFLLSFLQATDSYRRRKPEPGSRCRAKPKEIYFCRFLSLANSD